MLELIFEGILSCLAPMNLLTMFVAVALGIVVGALPGFGAATGLIIVLPLTYSMDPGTAFVALTGVYVGAEYGGSISSILLNTPGTGGAVVTCFDGFPLAKKGLARDALLVSNIASFSGGMVSGLAMLLFMPILGSFALRFGAGEIFVLAVVGLFLVGSISKGDPLKGIASAAMGVFMTCIGADAFMGNLRYDFDIPILIGGIPFIPVMLGVFSVPHLLSLILKPKNSSGAGVQEMVRMPHVSMGENMLAFQRLFRMMFSKMKILLLRSSFLGVFIGIIPGVGGTVATMVAYSASKRNSSHPEEFGKGSVEGLASAESSNNGLVGGSLIPVLALGIPGSPAAAIFMGAIFMHGMTPGPNFLIQQADLVYLLIMAVFLCAVVQLLLGLFTIGSLANILRIPASRLFPAVLVICSIGAYVVRGLEFDISLFVLFGFLAYFFVRMGYNAGAFILGMVLGSITERSMLEALTIASATGSIWEYFLSRRIAMVMVVFVLLYTAWRLYQYWKCPAPATDGVSCLEGVGSWGGLRGFDAALSVIFLAVTVWLATMLDSLPVSTAVFPRIVLSVLGISMLLLLLKALFFGRAYAGQNESPLAQLPWVKLGTIMVLWAIYVYNISLLGFYSASFIQVILLCIVLDTWEKKVYTQKRVGFTLLYSTCLIVCAYSIFHILFQINTPVGFLV